MYWSKGAASFSGASTLAATSCRAQHGQVLTTSSAVQSVLHDCMCCALAPSLYVLVQTSSCMIHMTCVLLET